MAQETHSDGFGPGDFDVAVVGGGASGMTLAAELGLQGIRTVLIERLEEAVDQPKAGTLHARTIQSLDRRGLLANVGDRSRSRKTAFHFGAALPLVIESPAGEAMPILGIPQVAIERAFERRSRDFGVDIRRGDTVLDVAPGKAHVRLVVRRANAIIYSLTAAWVVGCDGGRSLVRRAAGIGADEEPGTLRALLGKVRLSRSARVPRGWHMTERGWTLFNADAGEVGRVIAFDFSGPDAKRGQPLLRDEFDGALAELVGHSIAIDEHLFLSRFSDFSRLAETYRRGRILLAGDAAHLHFPLGGQGLNLGMQDAFNLGWKLAAVVRGASETLLDTYDRERRPVAAGVIANTHLQRQVMEPGPRGETVRTMIRRNLAVEDFHRSVAAMISAQDVRYRSGPACHPDEGCFAPNIPIDGPEGIRELRKALYRGQCVLVMAAAWHLDLAAVAALFSRWVVLCTTPESYHPAARGMLVRPDGYVAWVGDDAHQLHAMLTALCGAGDVAEDSIDGRTTILSHAATAMSARSSSTSSAAPSRA